jgi:hypothetical protein
MLCMKRKSVLSHLVGQPLALLPTYTKTEQLCEQKLPPKKKRSL